MIDFSKWVGCSGGAKDQDGSKRGLIVSSLETKRMITVQHLCIILAEQITTKEPSTTRFQSFKMSLRERSN